MTSNERLSAAERLINEVLEGGRLRDSLWERAALEWLGEDRVHCGCAEPIWKVWKDGSTYCTRCGNYQRTVPSETRPVHDAGCASYNTPAFTAVQTPCDCRLAHEIERLRAQEKATYRAAEREYHRLRDLLRRVRPRMTALAVRDHLAEEVDEEITRAEIKTHLIRPVETQPAVSNQKFHCKGCAAWDRIEAQYSELSRKYSEQRDDYERLRAALIGVMECSGTGTRHFHIARDALRGSHETPREQHTCDVHDHLLPDGTCTCHKKGDARNNAWEVYWAANFRQRGPGPSHRDTFMAGYAAGSPVESAETTGIPMRLYDDIEKEVGTLKAEHICELIELHGTGRISRAPEEPREMSLPVTCCSGYIENGKRWHDPNCPNGYAETARDETGWLIEVELGGRPHYWKASADARCIGEFDPDVNAALRLSREKDARDLALFLSVKGTIALSDVRKIKITEHAWPCSSVEPSELSRALHTINEAGKLSDWINRARPVITELMEAYARRIRTDCTPEQLEKEPWRCMEYIGAENLLRDQPIAVVEITPLDPPPELCPHGMPLAENVCGPCSKGQPNRLGVKASDALSDIDSLVDKL